MGMNSEEILNFAIESGILKLDDVQKKITMIKKLEALKKHEYEIWQGKNGRWYTYLPDNTSKTKRRQIAKSTQEKIEDEIFNFYRIDEEQSKFKNIKFKDFYLDWIDYKKLHVSEGMRDRIDCDYINLINVPNLKTKKLLT